MNSYQYFIVLGSRFLYLFELEDIWRSVFFVCNCFHLSALLCLIDCGHIHLNLFTSTQ